MACRVPPGRPADGRYLSRDDPSWPDRDCAWPPSRAPPASTGGARIRGGRPGRPLELRRDPDLVRPNAVAVNVAGGGGARLGFVPRELAAELAPELDEGTAWSALCLRERRSPGSRAPGSRCCSDAPRRSSCARSVADGHAEPDGLDLALAVGALEDRAGGAQRGRPDRGARPQPLADVDHGDAGRRDRVPSRRARSERRRRRRGPSLHVDDATAGAAAAALEARQRTSAASGPAARPASCAVRAGRCARPRERPRRPQPRPGARPRRGRPRPAASLVARDHVERPGRPRLVAAAGVNVSS